jgi:hypothetical protein
MILKPLRRSPHILRQITIWMFVIGSKYHVTHLQHMKTKNSLSIIIHAYNLIYIHLLVVLLKQTLQSELGSLWKW